MPDSAFPSSAFAELGYESAHHGDGRWNGVAILSRVGLEEVSSTLEVSAGSALASEPGRFLAAMCGGYRVMSVYVPNGRSIGSEHFEAKLHWLGALSSHLRQAVLGDEQIAVCGDFNVAPDDRDVWDPKAFVGSTHVSDAERNALEEITNLGLVDAFRVCYDQEKLFSWWDYRGGSFHRHMGMRIDLVLLNRSLAEKVAWALIDRNARKGSQPSDHAPVLVEVSQ